MKKYNGLFYDKTLLEKELKEMSKLPMVNKDEAMRELEVLVKDILDGKGGKSIIIGD